MPTWRIVGGRPVATSAEGPGPKPFEVGELDDDRVGGPITVNARVADVGVKKISIRVAVFKCGRCGRLAEEVQTTEQLKFPLACSQTWGGCGAKRREARFKLLEKESVYDEHQQVTLADERREDIVLEASVRGQFAGALPIGTQATFKGRLKKRGGRTARGELPYKFDVSEVTGARMPDKVVVYPKRVDPQIIYNIIVERQRRGEPTNYKVIVDEARKIGLAEEDVRAMLSKLLEEGKLEGQERDRQRRLKEENGNKRGSDDEDGIK